MGSGLFSSKGEGLKAFTLFEGVLMLVLGVLALIFPVLASAWITVIVAVGFLVGGIVGWVSNLARSRQLGRWYCFSRLVISTLFIVVGAWMIQQFRGGPLEGGVVVAHSGLRHRHRLHPRRRGFDAGGPWPHTGEWLGLGLA